MSLEDKLEELQLSDCRNSLGGFRLFGSENSQDNEETDQTMKQARKSLAWDSAFFASPGVLEPDELFRSVNSDTFSCEDEMLLPSGSLEPNVNGISDRCDLRKSLAWDNAFFTNAGVLDAEELARVNRGFNKSEAYLPEIEEDVLISTESSLSVNTANSSLTSLEIDLFEDVRKSNKLSHSASSLILHRTKASDKPDACSETRISASAPRRNCITPSDEKRHPIRTSSSAPPRKRIAARNSSPSVKPPKSAVLFRSASTVSTNFGKSGTANAGSEESHSVGPKRVNLKKLNSFTRCPTPTPTSSVTQKFSCSSSNRDSVLKTPTRDSSREFSTSKPSYCSSPDSYSDGWSLKSTSTSMTQSSKNSKASNRDFKTPLRAISLPSKTSKNAKPSPNAEISSAAKRERSANQIGNLRKPKSGDIVKVNEIGGQSPLEVKVNESTTIRIRLPDAYNVEKAKSEAASEERNDIIVLPRDDNDNKENVCGFRKAGGNVVIEISSGARSSVLTLIL